MARTAGILKALWRLPRGLGTLAGILRDPDGGGFGDEPRQHLPG